MNDQIPSADPTTVEGADDRYSYVFEHPSARGRFREGMSICRSIYRPVAELNVNEALRGALLIMVKDPRINAWLVDNDPQALEQAAQALAGAPAEIQPKGEGLSEAETMAVMGALIGAGRSTYDAKAIADRLNGVKPTVLVVRDPDSATEITVSPEGSVRIVEADLGSSFDGRPNRDDEEQVAVAWNIADRLKQDTAHLPESDPLRQSALAVAENVTDGLDEDERICDRIGCEHIFGDHELDESVPPDEDGPRWFCTVCDCYRFIAA